MKARPIYSYWNFTFPKEKTNAERRALWISKVPRKNWNPTPQTEIALCERHFKREDIIFTSTDTNVRRKRKVDNDDSTRKELKRKRLKDCAIPCIWPGAPALLTKVVKSRSTIARG